MDMADEKKYVYDFSEGKANMKELLGGKGANLAEMTTLGLPVPFGFTITTETCDSYYKNGKKYPEGMEKQVEEKFYSIINAQISIRLFQDLRFCYFPPLQPASMKNFRRNFSAVESADSTTKKK